MKLPTDYNVSGKYKSNNPENSNLDPRPDSISIMSYFTKKSSPDTTTQQSKTKIRSTKNLSTKSKKTLTKHHSLISRHASLPSQLVTNYTSYTMIIRDIERQIFTESQLSLDKRKHYNKVITKLQLLITQSKITKNTRMEFIFSTVLLSVYQKYRENFGETSDSFSRKDMLVLLLDTERLKDQVDEKWRGKDGQENLEGITKELLEEVMSNSDETECQSLLLGDGESVIIDESELRRSRTLPNNFKKDGESGNIGFRPELIYPKQSSVGAYT